MKNGILNLIVILLDFVGKLLGGVLLTVNVLRERLLKKTNVENGINAKIVKASSFVDLSKLTTFSPLWIQNSDGQGTGTNTATECSSVQAPYIFYAENVTKRKRQKKTKNAKKCGHPVGRIYDYFMNNTMYSFCSKCGKDIK